MLWCGQQAIISWWWQRAFRCHAIAFELTEWLTPEVSGYTVSLPTSCHHETKLARTPQYHTRFTMKYDSLNHLLHHLSTSQPISSSWSFRCDAEYAQWFPMMFKSLSDWEVTPGTTRIESQSSHDSCGHTRDIPDSRTVLLRGKDVYCFRSWRSMMSDDGNCTCTKMLVSSWSQCNKKMRQVIFNVLIKTRRLHWR